jgi:uncharacterized protein (DUF885 family)
VPRGALVAVALCAAACAGSVEPPALEFERARRQFVDFLLEQSPTLATDLGEHAHDARLADLSAAAIEAGARRAGALLARLGGIDPLALAAGERAEHAWLSSLLHAEILERREIRTHARNPMVYPLEISLGLLSLVERPFAPIPERMAAATGRLRSVSGLLETARANLERPPEILTRGAMATAEAVLNLVGRDLPEALGPVADLNAKADFEAARVEALEALRRFASWLRQDLLPRSDGDFALGQVLLERRLQLVEMLDAPLERLLVVCERRIDVEAAEVERLAAAIQPDASPREAFALLGRDHPGADGLVQEARLLMRDSRRFIEERGLLTLPADEEPRVEAAPSYLRAALAFLSPADPLAEEPGVSYYYLSPPEPGWTPGRAEAHLAEFGRPILTVLTLHETYPGHALLAARRRESGSLLRRAAASRSFLEGWALYGEQMMLEEGFGGGDPRLRLAQLRESLVRLCRLSASLRLHTHRMTLPEAERLFAERAFLDPLRARQEAERAVFDPGSLAYALGRLQILKLREDLRADRGERFSLREFHDALLREAGLPLALVRRPTMPDPLCKLGACGRRRALAPLAVAAAVAAALSSCRPQVPEGQLVESGAWDFYLNGEKVGTETYTLRRTGRHLQCQIQSEFPQALASARGRLRLSARYRPLEFELEAQRSPSGAMHLVATLEPGVARVRLKRGELAREDKVEISPRARLLEEGLVTLAQMALQGLDLRRRDSFYLPILLPQRFSEAQVEVENLGLERLQVGEGPMRPLRHLRLSLAGGASDYWVDEDRRVVRYLSRVPAGDLEARRRPKQE